MSDDELISQEFWDELTAIVGPEIIKCFNRYPQTNRELNDAAVPVLNKLPKNAIAPYAALILQHVMLDHARIRAFFDSIRRVEPEDHLALIAAVAFSPSSDDFDASQIAEYSFRIKNLELKAKIEAIGDMITKDELCAIVTELQTARANIHTGSNGPTPDATSATITPAVGR